MLAAVEVREGDVRATMSMRAAAGLGWWMQMDRSGFGKLLGVPWGVGEGRAVVRERRRAKRVVVVVGRRRCMLIGNLGGSYALCRAKRKLR